MKTEFNITSPESFLSEDRSQQFDYDAVEQAIDGPRAENLEDAKIAAALGHLLHWFASRAITRKHICPQSIGLRAIAGLWVVRPDLLGGVSLNSLSARVGLGVTDTILSRYAAEFRDSYGFKNRSQRSEKTRALMRAAHRPKKEAT